MKTNKKGTMATVTIIVAGIAIAALLASQINQPKVQNEFETKTNELGEYISLSTDKNFSGITLEEKSPEDIIEKRAFNTKAFKGTKKNEIKWRIFSQRIHFFDGEKWVDLNLISFPKIEKKEYPLQQKPLLAEKTTRFKIDSYLLHEGITATVNEKNEIIFSDEKKEEIVKIPPATATDSKQDLITGKYELLQKKQSLEIFVNIASEWLNNAKYPITIDPDINYTVTKADGDMVKYYCSTTSFDHAYANAVLVTPTIDSNTTTIEVGQSIQGAAGC